MGKYHILDSGGYFTNLQLYALREARRCWEELEKDYARHGEHTERLKERCVFAVSAMGFSLSQLLGQNNPNPETSVPPPKALLEAIVDEHSLSQDLVAEFEDFLYFYDGCRHFGASTSGIGHQRIDDLTFQATKECFRTGLKIWRELLDAVGKEPGNDLSGFDLDNDPPDNAEFYIPDMDLGESTDGSDG